jgi:hypothetical protein
MRPGSQMCGPLVRSAEQAGLGRPIGETSEEVE